MFTADTKSKVYGVLYYIGFGGFLIPAFIAPSYVLMSIIFIIYIIVFFSVRKYNRTPKLIITKEGLKLIPFGRYFVNETTTFELIERDGIKKIYIATKNKIYKNGFILNIYDKPIEEIYEALCEFFPDVIHEEDNIVEAKKIDKAQVIGIFYINPLFFGFYIYALYIITENSVIKLIAIIITSISVLISIVLIPLLIKEKIKLVKALAVVAVLALLCTLLLLLAFF